MSTSLRSRALRLVTERTVGPVAAGLPVNRYTLTAARPLIERALRAAAPEPRGTAATLVATKTVRGEWVRGPGADLRDAVVLYVHGGGFVAGSARSYRGVTARLSAATRLPVFAVDYRLAPEYPFPAAVHDVAAAYRWLVDRGHPPHRIVLAGDSAGGYLAAELALAQADRYRVAPAGLVLFSPLTDLTLAEIERDALLSPGLARAAVGLFTARPRPLRPRPATPLPPTLIHIGDSEFCTTSAARFTDRLRACGADCEVRRWPGQLHAFHAFPALIPESREAYRESARYIAARLAGDARSPAPHHSDSSRTS
ncbi:alpha/beta hydrolase [Nocardia blacklockiae]|uniref:alpha/beta hydrolase n=1 Tax=Nocardia blacklockiae TaxID=480036 RepID=UPI001894E5CE|nr:alpha/beta hydrolase fold domain-containing protein [Nocardia blacklockiae]MBF6171807.1 alpha/beta hydrolase fold domain-containing protein [Nocardia blacklockiae]